MKTPATVLVTGGTGFLGSVLVPLLLEARYRVIILCRRSTPRNRFVGVQYADHLRYYEIEDGLEQCFKDETIRYVIHLATSYGRSADTVQTIFAANIELPLQLLQLSHEHGVKAFLNADTFFHTEIGLKPKERLYMITKKSFLACAQGLTAASHRTKFLNFRIEQMYGPGDRHEKFVANMIAQLMSKRWVIRLTPGRQKRDFVYVTDVAQAFVLALKHISSLAQYEEFGIGTGKSVSIRSVVTMLKALTHSRATLAWGAHPYRLHEIMDSKAVLTKNKKIHWQARCELGDGLSRTVNAYRTV